MKLLLSEEEKRYLADKDYLEKEVKNLKGQKISLLKEIDSNIKKNSSLIEDQIAIEQKAKDIVEEAKVEAKSKVEAAQGKLNKASAADGEASGKLAELHEKIKDAEGLIKSNEGRENTLKIQINDMSKTKEKLKELIDTINEVLEEL